MKQENLFTERKMRTYSGLYVDVMNLSSDQVFPIDIATGLARICRFGGHTKRIWTVADHSVWCMQKGIELYPHDTDLHLRLLLHDAHEAYLGDWITPNVDAIDAVHGGFKEVIKAVKIRVQDPIDKRFGLGGYKDDARVTKIDKLALKWDWENKKLTYRGFEPLGDVASAEVWLNYFRELNRTPVVIWP